MLRNKMLDKVLVMILIFTLTFSNFALVTESLATSVIESVFGSNSDTGHKNVEFEAYFGAENEESYSVISDVNNQELDINFMLEVKKSGYLKDAQIEITEAEVGKGINYKLKEELELSDTVQSLEDNVLKLKQLSNSSEVNISIPIEYKNETYVNQEKLGSDSKIIFTGTYVDEKGNEVEVSKEITLNVSWKDEREVRLASEVTKYIQFGSDNSKGIILQTSVKADNTTEGNSLPVKESEITLQIPKIGGATPKSITVTANSTEGTNGRSAENVDFSSENWSFDSETNTLTIKAQNEKQLVTVDENEDEYLKDAEKEIVEEERYYSVSGTDEYLITYTFENIELSDEINITSNIEAKLVTLSGVEKDENINIATDNQTYEYILTGQTGDIVSYNIENQTNEVSKIYTYLNYNTDNKYELEYDTKTIVNISYKEIVQGIIVEDLENVYIDKQGNKIVHDDISYKQISISKDNFDNILGEDGNIELSDSNGNLIVTINKDYEVNEDGNFVINFNDRYSKLVIKTSSPINEGNLIINNKKVTKGTSLDKTSYKNLDYIATNVKASAKYSYVENSVEIGTITVSTKLADTATKANLVLDRDNLSTLATNNNVELRIELNNDKETSDIYGNSVFEIEMPAYIESLEITNTSILYAEGLDISNVEAYARDEKAVIRITLNGKQEIINSDVIANGTNIVINANIKVDLYTPAMEEEIKLYYYNEEATNYTNRVDWSLDVQGSEKEIATGCGYENLVISYSAPTGLVAVNSTSNYNNVGSVLTSVKQGTQEDIIEIYSEAKTATMEVIVMNNNSNTVSDVSILGRIPFKGVKDIATGGDLGTTVDTTMLNGIVPDERNSSTSFTVYYSENGEATKDITDNSNGWTKSPASLENVKSYLIVPIDSNYKMEEAEILRFTYEYEIPANLSHNEDIFGTFLIYYTNNSEIAITKDVAIPDLVGLTTGEGPELGLEVSTSRNEIKEYEELKITAKVSNVGSSTAKEVKVNMPIPNNASYSSIEAENEEISAEINDNVVTFDIGSLEVGQTVTVALNITANKYPTIAQYYKETEGFIKLEDGTYVIRTYEYVEEGENGEESYIDEVIDSVPEVTLDVKATTIAKDLEKELSSDSTKVNIKQAEFTITEKSELVETADAVEYEDYIFGEGKTTQFMICVTNIAEETKNNVVVTKTISSEFSYVEAYTVGYEEDGLTTTKIQNAVYDETTRTVTWNLGNLSGKSVKQLNVEIKINSLPDGVTKYTTYSSSQVTADGCETYESNTVKTIIGKPSLVINQTTNTTNTYVTEGTIINYTFTIKNEGSVSADSVTLTDKIPEGLIVRKITYTANGIEGTKKISSNSEAVINTSILAGEELVVNIEALANSLKGIQELTVTNLGTVSATNIDQTTTNSITHIIEPDPNSAANQTTESSTGNGTYGGSTSSNLVKTYKLTGIAWLDENENGMRDEGEKLLSGITARLVNSETGVIAKSVTTDSKGEYSFSGISNGNYLVIFEYDTIKYTVTSYQKAEVESNVNSDVITTKIEQDGKQKNGAVTDVININDSSVSNIDIGFVLADAFDLKLDKTISKVTTQNKSGTATNSYDNVTLAKTEIGAKYLSSSTVYVEYTILVSNLGDVSGYAKKVVDYIPEGMTFNSGLNSNWYTGTDGNLYTTELSDTEIKPGETKQVKLVLTKQMTEENTGLVHNTAEIYEDYNIYGISDTNSLPGNNAQGENDLGSADAIISVKTGEVFIYISVIITSIILGSVVIFIAYNKIVISKRKGGV